MADKPKSKLDEMLATYKTESHHGAAKKRQTTSRQIQDYIDGHVKDYFIKIHGEDKEVKGTPAKYSVKGHDDAHKLVVEMAKATLLKKGLSKSTVEDLAKNEAVLLDWFDAAVGQKGYSHQLAANLADSPDNIMDNRQYNHAKQLLGNHVADHKLNMAREYLTHNLEARDRMESELNKAASKHGVEVKKGLRQHHMVEHLGTLYEEGQLTEKYVKTEHPTHYTAAKKKAA